MITDNFKDTSKGAFKGAILTAIGAALVYMVIKMWEKKTLWPF